MSYSSEVLADSPEFYWRLGDAGPTLQDATANNRDGSILASRDVYYPWDGTTRTFYYNTEPEADGLIPGDADKSLYMRSGYLQSAFSTGWTLTDNYTFEFVFSVPPINYVDWGGGVISEYEVDQFNLAINRNGHWAVYVYGGASTITNVRHQVTCTALPPPASGYSSAMFVLQSDAPGAVPNRPYAPQRRHVVVRVNGTPGVNLANQIFMDGVELAAASPTLKTKWTGYSGATSVSPSVDSTGHFTIEGSMVYLDEVAYYPTALSDARIRAHAVEIAAKINGPTLLQGTGSGTQGQTRAWTGVASLINPVTVNTGTAPNIARWTNVADLRIPVEIFTGTTANTARFTQVSTLSAEPVALYESTSDTPRIGLSSHSGFAIVPAGMTMTVLDPDQRRSPTTLTVALSGAIPDDMVSFTVNGGTPRLVQADWSGNIPLVNIDVPSSVGVGSHTVEASSGTGVYLRVAESPFTIELVPEPQFFPAPDEVVVDVPAAAQPTGRKWVFQDLMPGGLGSWVLPRNPSQSGLPVVRRVLEPVHTTARTGVHHIFESRTDVTEWQFGGLVCTQEEQQQLEAFAALNRRFYIIDHLNRAWVATISNLETVPRLRTLIGLAGEAAELSDWVADNTVTATVYGSTWYTPT